MANIAFRVSNLEAARDFYGHVMGYKEFSLSPGRDEGPPEVIYYKVNDRQYIEISPGLKDQTEDRLLHIGFETDDAQRLRDYLAGHGVKVPEHVTKDVCGNLNFKVMDPDGHAVEFVQYLPDSMQGRNAGNFMPRTRLSDHILHVGIHVADSAKADRLYKDILGFRLLWEGGPAANPKAWISYLVPNGSDWVEYMTTANPNPKQLGGMHHVCLEVMDIQKPYETALARGYTPPGKPLLARDGRWLANFYDPDGSRTELMIRKPAEKPCCRELHDPYIAGPSVHATRNAGGQAPRDLRCENAANPRDVTAPRPHLSWVLNPNMVQRAYQVLVASSEEKLAADEGDLWDSGRVVSDQRAAQYRGKTLPSLQHCYWKVRIWAAYYQASGYSGTASWEMAR